MISALMLDFYGTVVGDDRAVIAGICAQVAATLARPLPAAEIARQWSARFAALCAGTGGAFMTQREAAVASLGDVLMELGSPADARQLAGAQFGYWRHPPLFPDTIGFLSRVTIPVCIVSNIDRADLEAALGYHGLTFDHVVTSEEARSYKPRPEPFEQALGLLGVPRAAVLHAGDSLTSDVAGAGNAGIAAAWVNRTGRARPTGITLRAEVADLTELASLLRPRRQPRRSSR